MKTNLEALASHLVLAEESLIGQSVSIWLILEQCTLSLSHEASSGIVVTVAIKDHP